MQQLMDRLAPNWSKKPGATNGLIEKVEQALGFHLPEDYKAFVRWSNGGEGQVGNIYLSLWRVENIKELNEDYQIGRYLPHVVGIGSDAGGECYAFDYRIRGAAPAFILVPFGDLEPEAVNVVGSSFREALENALGVE